MINLEIDTDLLYICVMINLIIGFAAGLLVLLVYRNNAVKIEAFITKVKTRLGLAKTRLEADKQTLDTDLKKL